MERPDLDELRDLVTTGGLDVVVVSKRERLARGVYAGYLKNEFKRRGVELVALDTLKPEERNRVLQDAGPHSFRPRGRQTRAQVGSRRGPCRDNEPLLRWSSIFRTPGCWSQNTILPELRFRALLDKDGTRQIELARAWDKGSSPAFNGGTAHS